MNLYERVVNELLAQKIPFLIIGSYARLWNKMGHVFPKDLDIWIYPVLSGKSITINSREVVLKQDCVVEIQDGVLRLNIFTTVHGLDFTTSLQRGKKRILKDKITLNYINRHDCLTNLNEVKKIWDS